MQPSGGRGHGVLEAACQASSSNEVAMGHFDPPGVTNGSKDLGTVFVAWWLVPSDPADLAVEPHRQPCSGGQCGAAVNEHELEAFMAPVRARSSRICSTALASDVEAGTTGTQSGSPVTSTQTMRLAPLVRPYGPPWLWKVTPPLEAPRARWVSMTTIEGRGSIRPRAVRDDACSAVRTRAHVPFRDHRRNWDQTRVHGPNASGRNRRWHPVCEM